MANRNGASTAEAELEQLSAADLVKLASDQATRLAQQEIELAKAELAIKAKRIGIGAGAFGAAGVLGALTLACLTATAILALSTAVAAWLAALIVTCLYGAGAATGALLGRSKVKDAGPPVPEQATESVKEDVEWIKTRAKSGRT